MQYNKCVPTLLLIARFIMYREKFISFISVTLLALSNVCLSSSWSSTTEILVYYIRLATDCGGSKTSLEIGILSVDQVCHFKRNPRHFSTSKYANCHFLFKYNQGLGNEKVGIYPSRRSCALVEYYKRQQSKLAISSPRTFDELLNI